MAHNLQPVTGEWYRHLDKGQPFRVISVERDEDLIEIQSFDGDLEEFEFAEWFAMDLAPAAAPEDWSGPMDDIEPDDLDSTDNTASDNDWRVSLEASAPATEAWQDDTPEDERDEGQPARKEREP
jgi:hypothetical protein